MFDANAGFFNLVFANIEDDYYTPSYIKTDFWSYLRLQLIEDGFRYLCFVNKTPFGHQREYRLTLAGGLDISMLQQASAHRGFFDNLFMRGNNRNDVWDTQERSRKSCVEVNPNTLREYMSNILSKMSEQRGIAVLCPLDIFSVCCEDEGILKALIERQKKPNQNIMILTGSVNAAENDVYFRSLAVQDTFDNTSVFRNGKLFPNIEKYINSRRDKLTKLVFTYELLKEAFGKRMYVLNDLSFEKLCLAVKYAVMRNNWVSLRHSPDCYAAVIYAWYENERFRQRYEYLNLPENPLRETKIVTDAIVQGSFFDLANRVLQSELEDINNDEAQDIADFWRSDYKGVPIVYDLSAKNERVPAVRDCLIAFRRQLRGHEDILKEEEWRDIEMMVQYFGRPSYSLYEGQSVLPHERCVDYKGQIDKLYHSLKKEVWNSWDDSAMKLLFVMFKRCYEYTRETEETTQDRGSYLGEQEFKTCMKSIEHCMLNSVRYPGESNRAKFFYSDTKQVLCCEDPNRVRTYCVSEVTAR